MLNAARSFESLFLRHSKLILGHSAAMILSCAVTSRVTRRTRSTISRDPFWMRLSDLYTLSSAPGPDGRALRVNGTLSKCVGRILSIAQHSAGGCGSVLEALVVSLTCKPRAIAFVTNEAHN